MRLSVDLEGRFTGYKSKSLGEVVDGQDVLQDNVLGLMSTLHGYIFTIDIEEINYKMYVLITCFHEFWIYEV